MSGWRMSLKGRKTAAKLVLLAAVDWRDSGLAPEAHSGVENGKAKEQANDSRSSVPAWRRQDKSAQPQPHPLPWS